MAALARFEELRLKLVDWKLEQYGPPLFDAGFDDLSTYNNSTARGSRRWRRTPA